MSSSLTAYNNDGIEIYIDNKTGESFCSLSAYSRMTGVKLNTIGQRIKREPGTVHNLEEKTTEITTSTGLKTVHILGEQTVVAWLVKDKPELLAKFAVMGIRKFMHTTAGYEPSNAITVFTCPVDAEIKRIDAEKIAIASEISKLEKRVGELRQQYTTLDVRRSTLYVDKYMPVAREVDSCQEILTNNMCKNLPSSPHPTKAQATK